MFISDSLIYIHMQKAAGSHIVRLLSQLFDGKVVGIHNAATPTELKSGALVMSSIRNPWDWYLSLWTYGVQGKGAFASRLTQKNFLFPAKSSLRTPQDLLANFRAEFQKDSNTWSETYADGENVEGFRIWLKLVHDPTNSILLGEGYSGTLLPSKFGFMTHRYLNLCCMNLQRLKNPDFISGYSDLKYFDTANCYIDRFVRQENLETELCDAISAVRKLKDKELDLIYRSQKTNTSHRALTLADYYDEESIELVRQRERLLIEKFDYQFGNSENLDPPNKATERTLIGVAAEKGQQ